MTQSEKIYMISDAAKQVEVEAHVLRYWEEELQISTRRNEMGHRYYTEEDILKFRRIKELKEQGLQLKAIRHMLKSGSLLSPVLMFEKKGEGEKEEMKSGADTEQSEMDMTTRHVVMVKKGEFLPMEGKNVAVQEESREQKSMRLQQLLRDMIVDAVQSNNQELCQEIKESLLKELDYQFRLQEEREEIKDEERIRRQEEHYQQIDELLRSYNQRGRKGRKMRRENEAHREMNGEQSRSERKRKKEKIQSQGEADSFSGDEPGEKDFQEKKGFQGKGFLRKKRSVV